MIVIIDGYNLLKQVFNKVKGKLDIQREQLIKELIFYKKTNVQIKEIIVVFDGGLSLHSERQIKNGIVVIFSGQKISADDWIFEYVEKNKNKEILLVTKDNELKTKCKKCGADAIDVFDFYDIVLNTITAQVEFKFDKNENKIQKIESDDYVLEQLCDFKPKSSEALDVLMSHIDIDFAKKDNEPEIKNFKSLKIPKKEKQIYKKIKKL
ncbi:NYN domain-containing protein [Candidatus Dependentiae bacterium]|nr:NYN domain-containing protein [Candidatus Dependentiae bacterium]MBU4387322.1 NYN domain-containing protein [Candidatus Dependentiae bacterium]MCG2756213.1 NYN domain-containing protein [Candidatus Dependentiae bacterium]